jgi:hypothetical protein
MTMTHSPYLDLEVPLQARGGVPLLLLSPQTVSLAVVVVVVVVVPAALDLQQMTWYLDSAAAVAVAARCQDSARVLEAQRWMARGHVVDSMLMTGLIGGAVGMEEDVAAGWADTRVADVPREEGLVAVVVVRGGVARVQHVEGADVTNFLHFIIYHLNLTFFLNCSRFVHAIRQRIKIVCLYCSF